MKRPLAVAAVLAGRARPRRAPTRSAASTSPRPTRKLFNQASQVALVRDGDDTVLTMANDFQGDPKEFALVVPVPTFIEREQIEVVDKALLDHLDAYSAPRLVEYFDEDPCTPSRTRWRPPRRRRACRTMASRSAQDARRHRRGDLHRRRVRHPHPRPRARATGSRRG